MKLRQETRASLYTVLVLDGVVSDESAEICALGRKLAMFMDVVSVELGEIFDTLKVPFLLVTRTIYHRLQF